MPRNIKGIKIFVGSPGGLDSLRKEFRQIIDQYNRLEALPLDVHFEAVGWEDTLPTSTQRGQAVINDELRGCDYALFLLRDRWGSPPDASGGSPAYTSGTEEEYAVAGECIVAKSMLDRSVLFLPVAQAQLKDPGEQLTSVLAFKQRLINEKSCLFQHLDDDARFAEVLRGLLGRWRRKHEPRGTGRDASSFSSAAQNIELSLALPREQPDAAARLSDTAFDTVATAFRKSQDMENFAEALTLATLAHQLATQPANIAWAMSARGRALDQLDRGEDAIAQYDELIERYGSTSEPVLREHVARAMLNKGVSLGQLDRSEDAITQYDELIERYGAASEPAVRGYVATAMFRKGLSLGLPHPSEDAIAQYDELIAHYGTASETLLRERVALAMFARGLTLGELDRSEEAIAQYDKLIARYGSASEPLLREWVAQAMLYKGITLGKLDCSEDAITQYDELIVRYGAANEPALRERVAEAILNKGVRLGQLGRSEDAITQYDELITRYRAATESALREGVAKAMWNKGVTLGQLDRSEDEIAQWDELIARYGAASELLLRSWVARAIFNKGFTLGRLDRNEDAITQYDALIARYGAASEPALQDVVAAARRGRAIQQAIKPEI